MEFGGLLEAPGSTGVGVHLASLRRLLPDYRLLTMVEVGNGRTMAFWHDCWTAIGPLAEAYPALFTHVRRSEASVHSVMSSPLRHAFVPRFSATTAEEYVALSSLVADVALIDDVDARRCPWEDAAGKLSSSALYRAVVSTGAGCDFYKFIWESCAPQRSNSSAGSVQNRIQMKENLLKKHCLHDDTCEICNEAVECGSPHCGVPLLLWLLALHWR
jgi:hypothetical protein